MTGAAAEPGMLPDVLPAEHRPFDEETNPGAPAGLAAEVEQARVEAQAQRARQRPAGAVHTPLPGWFYSVLPNKLGVGATINLPPIFITELLGGNVASVGIATALTSAAMVPAAAFWGWLSDRYASRKLYLVLGYLGYSVPTILTAFTTEVWQYMALALLLGAWSVAGTPVSSTLIMDTVPREEWDETFGRFNAINGWGVVAGRLVGLLCIAYGIGLIGNEQTQRGLWLLSGGLGLLSVLWAWRTVPVPGVPKPRPHRAFIPLWRHPLGAAVGTRLRSLPQLLYHLRAPKPRPAPGQSLSQAVQRGLRNTASLVRNPLIAYNLTSFVMFAMSVMAYTPFAVWQRQELGNSVATVFLVGMTNSVASALTYRRMGRLINRHGSMRVQMVTNVARVITFCGFAVVGWLGITGASSTAILLLLNALSGLGWAGIAVAGNTTVAHLASRGSEGAAVGAYTSFVSVGSIVGAFISGYLVLWMGYEWVFFLGGLGVALTVLFLGQIRRHAPAAAREHL